MGGSQRARWDKPVDVQSLKRRDAASVLGLLPRRLSYLARLFSGPIISPSLQAGGCCCGGAGERQEWVLVCLNLRHGRLAGAVR